jgi:hypothetical protein
MAVSSSPPSTGIQRGHSVDAFLSMSLFATTSFRNRVTSAVSLSSGPNRLMRKCRQIISCDVSSSTAKFTAPTPTFLDRNFRSHSVNSFALAPLERTMTKAHVSKAQRLDFRMVGTVCQLRTTNFKDGTPVGKGEVHSPSLTGAVPTTGCPCSR